MKKLGLFLIVTSLNLYAQDVINAAPLNIDPMEGRSLMKDDAPVGSLVPAVIDPVDGHLKLNEKETIKPSKDIEVEKSFDKTSEEKPSFFTFNPPEKYLQFGFGYLNSKYSNVDPVLENGSRLTEFRVLNDMNQHYQFGFAIELIHDTTGDRIPENIRALQYKLFLDNHQSIFTDKLDWMTGIALSVGDYSIRKLSLDSNGQKVYTKIRSGTMVGIIPSAALRFYLFGRNSIDFAVEYHQYLSKPQSYIGGFAFVPRLSFVF